MGKKAKPLETLYNILTQDPSSAIRADKELKLLRATSGTEIGYLIFAAFVSLKTGASVSYILKQEARRMAQTERKKPVDKLSRELLITFSMCIRSGLSIPQTLMFYLHRKHGDKKSPQIKKYPKSMQIKIVKCLEHTSLSTQEAMDILKELSQATTTLKDFYVGLGLLRHAGGNIADYCDFLAGYNR